MCVISELSVEEKRGGGEGHLYINRECQAFDVRRHS